MKTITKTLRLLEKKHPNPKLELDFKTPLELLIATILAAQCTDERVNEVTKELFKKYKTAEDYAKANLMRLQKEIRSTGFFRQKAKRMKECCTLLVENFDGDVPQDRETLASMKGIGRKTANMILGNAFGQQAIAVDTHVQRVSQRLGLATSKTPEKIEEELCALIPKPKWTKATLLFVLHGRYTCTAKKPQCLTCVVGDLCPSKGKFA